SLLHHVHRSCRALYSMLFFFHSLDRALPDLPSFPTRRSSDLWTASAFPDWVSSGLMLIMTAISISMWRMMPNRTISFSTVAMVRSEEHTSELQSRVDLVCRLLLEKKKALPHSKELGVRGHCAR